jgi:dTMP kinase
MTRADQSTDVPEPTGAPGDTALAEDSRERAVGALLRIPRLRRLWTAQLTGGIADRLALLVLLALAVQAAFQAQSFGGGYRGVGFAVAAVFAARLVATLLCGAVLLGPLSALTTPGGPLDRRWTMIGCDAVRLALLIVAPLWIDWTQSSAIIWVLATAFVLGVAERIWTVARSGAAAALLPVPAGLLTPLPAVPASETTEPAPAAPVSPAAATGPGLTLRLGKLGKRSEDAPAGTPGAFGKSAQAGAPEDRNEETAGAAGAPRSPKAAKELKAPRPPKPAKARPQVTHVRPSAAHLEALRRLDLRTGYGTVPLAAAALVAVTLVGNLIAVGVHWFHTHQVALASDAAAGLFAASAAVLYLLDLPNAAGPRPRSPLEGLRRPEDGKGRTGAVPVLVLGTAVTCAAMAAAFALAVLHTADLGEGPVGFGLLALVLTGGPVIGIRTATRILPGLSRRRLFALAIAVTGLALLLAGIVNDTTTVLLLALLAGVGVGVAANTGHTLLDDEVEEPRQARATEHLHAVVRVLVGTAAVAGPLIAGLIGPHRVDKGHFAFAHGGASFTLMLAGALLLPVAALVLGRIDDRQGVPLGRDLRDALLGGPEPEQRPYPTGFFIALEGGDGAGKSTQVERLAEWIRAKGHEVVVTREPGATAIGKRLRSILLDVSSSGLSHRCEALLYAADRAEHVDSVIRPALARGAVVITDRYIDSSVAYQGAGRDLSPIDIARVSRWATDGLVPHLTVLLDISPEDARERFTQAPDRMESEPAEFHQRVRGGFLALAAADPSRYLVVDAGQDPETVATTIRHRLDRELPLSEQEIQARAEAERKAAEEARRRAEEEARRKAEEERRERERQEMLARLRAEEEERKRIELEEARRREEERLAEEARRRAEEARRKAEEEARRREAEEKARREEEARRLRQAAEEERLREEAEARRLERQRKAEEALLRAEEARRKAEAEKDAPPPEPTQTVELPKPEPGSPPDDEDAVGPDDKTRTIETPRFPPPDAPGDSGGASGPSDTTQTVETPRPRPPHAADETKVFPKIPEWAAEDETTVLPPVAEPPRRSDDATPPADRVPPWLWRSERTAEDPAERTRELPQVDPAPEPGARPAPQPGRRPRRRSDWAEETPLDDLPTLADELLGPHDERDDEDTGGGRPRRGRR